LENKRKKNKKRKKSRILLLPKKIKLPLLNFLLLSILELDPLRNAGNIQRVKNYIAKKFKFLMKLDK
jgi:hypothetical protein